MAPDKLISVETIQQHDKADDCWIVVDDKVWDMTEFAPKHPGGPEIILRYAGRNATSAYNEIHSPGLIHSEIPQKLLGNLDTTTITQDWVKPPPSLTSELAPDEKPPLETIINTQDFEDAAQRSTSKKTWAFYSSAATDCYTRDANKSMFDRIWLRPRVLRNVKTVSTRARIFGHDMSMPIFVSPAAMARMIHPDGEKAIAKACAKQGVIQVISTSASYSAQEIIPAAHNPAHPFLFQLYINSNRTACTTLIRTIASLPSIKGIMITIDAPVVGKREADERIRADETIRAPMSGQQATNDSKGGGMGRVMGAYIDPSFCWSDLAWVRSLYPGPILLKGVQTAADAKLAVQYGVQGIVVSNHGGRCLDTSPPAILALLDIQRNAPEVFDHLEVYVDGGVRRGTDILKALALGATGVGLGRPFLYACNYGSEGVEHLIELLKDELETTMRLVGVNHLSELHPGMVNTLDVDGLVPTRLESHPYARKVVRPKL